MDGWIMDGWMLSHTGRRAFKLSQNKKQERSKSENAFRGGCLLPHSPNRRRGVWRAPSRGFPLWKPILQNKTKAICLFGLFGPFSCSPLATGREVAVCCFCLAFFLFPANREDRSRVIYFSPFTFRPRRRSGVAPPAQGFPFLAP